MANKTLTVRTVQIGPRNWQWQYWDGPRLLLQGSADSSAQAAYLAGTCFLAVCRSSHDLDIFAFDLVMEWDRPF